MNQIYEKMEIMGLELENYVKKNTTNSKSDIVKS